MESFEKAEKDMRQGDRENLPDRQAAERNSVYNRAGEGRDNEDLKDLPDRQVAERNSVYKVAHEAHEKWAADYEDSARRSEALVNNNRPAGGQGSTNSANARRQGQGGRIPSARQENQQVYSNRRDYGGEGKKENNLDGTVSLNTDPIDQPSKLDNL